MRTLKGWWPRCPRPGNLGDALNPHLFGRFGVRVEWVPFEDADFLGVGSVLGRARSGMHVFGSGLLRRSDRPSPGARFWAARGPLSAAAVREVGGEVAALGDPALLLPLVHDRPVEKRRSLGIVPHYVDRDRVRDARPDALVIDPVRRDPFRVVDEIRSCRSIVSSSLHGLVVAQAYGIPYAWVRFSDGLAGDDVKFADFAASVGIELTPFETVGRAVLTSGGFDPDPLLAAMKELEAWSRS